MLRDKMMKIPIYAKAMHIYDLIEALLKTIPEDNDFLQSQADIMRADAMMIPAKIAGAEGGGLYSIRMQNAAIIRKCAMDLYVFVGGLRYDEEFKDVDYVELIRQEIEGFRLMFINWVQSFDTSNYIWDEWELFNPPGAIPPSDDDYNDPINWDDFEGFDDDFDE